MNRLTEKVYCGYDVSDRKLKNDYTDEEIFKALQKLGRLEDLFEKYKINDIEELEIIIGRKELENEK